MMDLTRWWSEIDGSSQPWLLLGKGPSFKRRDEYDLSGYRTVALNHAVRELAVFAASAADLDVVDDCGEAILANARYLLMPRYPHVWDSHGVWGFSERPLEALLGDYPALQEMDRQGRLVWYNLSTAPRSFDGSPVIPAGSFSSEVLTRLIGMMGGRKIRTLGIDGGMNYASQFADLSDRTRLTNGQQSFDTQFASISRTILKYDLDVGPLDVECPMRIFVGCDESQRLGARVLEYSLRRNSSISSVFDTMLDLQLPMPSDPMKQPRTNFSFNRFAIPARAGYRGRAVYVDADMLVLKDFRQVWTTPFDGASILHCASSDPTRPKQFSVMLLDCEALDWDAERIIRGLEEDQYDYDALMKEFCIVPPEAVRDDLPAYWNSLEQYEPGVTGLIHYTDMATQPWVSQNNPNGWLWSQYLRDAIDDGFIAIEEVDESVDRGFVRPSLLWQLRQPRPSWPIPRKVGTLAAKAVTGLLDSRISRRLRLRERFSRRLDGGYVPHATLVKRLESVMPALVQDEIEARRRAAELAGQPWPPPSQ